MCVGLPAKLLRTDMLVDARQVPDWLVVSHETLAKLEAFLDLVIKWNPTINLISAGSVGQAWSRHVLDSAQLWGMVRADGIWLDIGSGGGFPGLVISILAQEAAPDLRVVLVESDRRKSVFLAEAVRQLSLTAEVHCARIESMTPIGAKVVSARALAPLAGLLPLVAKHLAADGVALIPKGQRHLTELEECRKHWLLQSEPVVSKTDSMAAILKIWGLQHA